MRITAGMMGIFLIAAAVVAQNDDMAAATVVQGDDMTAPAVVQNDDVTASAVVLDDDAIAAKVHALQKHVAIASARAKVIKQRKSNAKAETIKVVTEQDQDDPFVGTMRFTIQMADGTNMWYGQEQLVQEKWTGTTAEGKETGKIDYTGEDNWTFKIPIGKGTDLENPTVKGYAVEYGFVVNNKVVSNKFVVVAAKYRQVASAEEIMDCSQEAKNVLQIQSTGKALREGEGEEKESSEDEQP